MDIIGVAGVGTSGAVDTVVEEIAREVDGARGGAGFDG